MRWQGPDLPVLPLPGAAVQWSQSWGVGDTGEVLWETRLNGDISGAPVTFEVDGKQYVAVGSGGRIAQTTSYAGLIGIDTPQGTGVMWVFALP